MARRKKRRKSRFIGAFIVVLTALAAAMAILALMRRLDDSKVAKYPVLYVDEICAAANENSVPAPYIAAVIMAESSYNPEAVSSVGAQGLMQIMPDTAKWISGKLDDSYTDTRMFDPVACIRYGTWYLRFLLERYSGDMRCATAAYHAGQGTVDRWLDDPEYSRDGATLYAMEYDSTSTYVERVMNYYEYYTNAYIELFNTAENLQ